MGSAAVDPAAGVEHFFFLIEQNHPTHHTILDAKIPIHSRRGRRSMVSLQLAQCRPLFFPIQHVAAAPCDVIYARHRALRSHTPTHSRDPDATPNFFGLSRDVFIVAEFRWL